MHAPSSVTILATLLLVGCGEPTDPGIAQETTPDAAVTHSGGEWPIQLALYDVTGRDLTSLGSGTPEQISEHGAFGPLGGPCRRGPHRDFDFWLGSYELFEADGSAQGTNRIGTALRGCVITEAYADASGVRGRSLSAYDGLTDRWIQTFVGEGSTNYRLTGGLEDGAMVMVGGRLFPLADGSLFPVVERVRWTPLPESRVGQTVELSVDGGSTFPFTTTDLTYSPSDAESTAPPGTTACSDDAFRAIDFWLGDWTVRVGPFVVGRSRIHADLSGCLVEEVFRSRWGRDSRSFYSFDRTTERWNRIYVDDRGSAFRLAGEAATERVDLLATRPLPGGGSVEVHNSVRRSGGGVLQSWSVTKDGRPIGHPLVLKYTAR